MPSPVPLLEGQGGCGMEKRLTGIVRDIKVETLPWEEDIYEIGIGKDTLDSIFAEYLSKNIEVVIKILPKGV